MVWVAASVVALFALLGTLLTLVTLPGTWIMLLVALVCKLFVPELMGWSWLIAAGTLAVIGEVVEFLASAAGAKAGGAGKPGAWGALIGGLLGGIIGTITLAFLPILGTIIGGVVGAGVLAVLFERWKGGKGWKASSKAGAGAAAGKLASTFLKAGIAGVMGVVLTIGAVWGAGATLGDQAVVERNAESPASADSDSLDGPASGMLERGARPQRDTAPGFDVPGRAGAETPPEMEDTDVRADLRSA